jgi:hypothetical protein
MLQEKYNAGDHHCKRLHKIAGVFLFLSSNMLNGVVAGISFISEKMTNT